MTDSVDVEPIAVTLSCSLSSDLVHAQPPRRIPTPHCKNLSEHPEASATRTRLNDLLTTGGTIEDEDALTVHLFHGLAYTIGSALGSTPPTQEQCLSAFLVQNKVKLTAGARAWSKHAHRSAKTPDVTEEDTDTSIDKSKKKKKQEPPSGWWGRPFGSVVSVNERALALFWKIFDEATWRNLHWLPHGILVYEVRVHEGYGMRWSQDLSGLLEDGGWNRLRAECMEEAKGRIWTFRGFVEPMMDNGHEVGWRH